MIDIFTIKQGDLVEYGPYICSESLRDHRSYGVYQDYMIWSPDGRPVEMWVILLDDHGMRRCTRASQITRVFSAGEALP